MLKESLGDGHYLRGETQGEEDHGKDCLHSMFLPVFFPSDFSMDKSVSATATCEMSITITPLSQEVLIR